MTEFAASIPGDPATQGSKRQVRGGQMVESDPKLKPWRLTAIHQLSEAATEAGFPAGFDGPVAVEATYYFTRPSSHYGTGRNSGQLKESAPEWKSTKPDVDKMDRALLDALTQSGVLRDDARVVSLFSKKLYGPQAVATVRVRAL